MPEIEEVKEEVFNEEEMENTEEDSNDETLPELEVENSPSFQDSTENNNETLEDESREETEVEDPTVGYCERCCNNSHNTEYCFLDDGYLVTTRITKRDPSDPQFPYYCDFNTGKTVFNKDHYVHEYRQSPNGYFAQQIKRYGKNRS